MRKYYTQKIISMKNMPSKRGMKTFKIMGKIDLPRKVADFDLRKIRKKSSNKLLDACSCTLEKF